MSRLLYHLIKAYVPKQHTRQTNSETYLELLFNQGRPITQVMDLGCGPGHSLDYFRLKNPAIQWVGLDIAESPEVNARLRKDGEFCTYDGRHMPFADNSFDLIYSHQVLEHVRYPARLLAEVQRVLKPQGYFVGSTSHLEPFHSYSLWNYTPFGFLQLVEAAGLQLLEISAGIDALTLMIRQGLGGPKLFSIWLKKESPLNLIINVLGRLIQKEPAWINAAKLVFCGHFCFLVCKPKPLSVQSKQ